MHQPLKWSEPRTGVEALGQVRDFRAYLMEAASLAAALTAELVGARPKTQLDIGAMTDEQATLALQAYAFFIAHQKAIAAFQNGHDQVAGQIRTELKNVGVHADAFSYALGLARDAGATISPEIREFRSRLDAHIRGEGLYPARG